MNVFNIPNDSKHSTMHQSISSVFLPKQGDHLSGTMQIYTESSSMLAARNLIKILGIVRDKIW